MAELNRIYDISFSIGNTVLSRSIKRVEIASSLNFIFDIFLIKLLIDSDTILDEQLLGQTTANLNITLTTESVDIRENINLDLIIVKSNFPVIHKESEKVGSLNQDSTYQPRFVTLVCVPLIPFKVMYTPVNTLIQDDKGLVPIEICQKITDTFLKDIGKLNKNIDKTNINDNKIFQLMIPPTNYINAIRYIDGRYPLYNGRTPFIYCRFSDNTLCIWDLKKKLKEEEYKIIFLSPGIKDQNEIWKTPNNGKTYFTYSEIKTKYKSNEKIILNSYKTTCTGKPIDKLFSKFDIDVSQTFQDNSLTDRDSSLQYNKELQNLRAFFNNISAVDYNDALVRKNLTNKINDFSDITFNINAGDLPFLNLSKVGVSITLDCIKNVYAEYVGKYIVKNSFLIWEREKQPYFQCNCQLNCIRGYYITGD